MGWNTKCEYLGWNFRNWERILETSEEESLSFKEIRSAWHFKVFFFCPPPRHHHLFLKTILSGRKLLNEKITFTIFCRLATVHKYLEGNIFVAAPFKPKHWSSEFKVSRIHKGEQAESRTENRFLNLRRTTL